ncbi:hypothetical protein EPUL_005436, partial [Erysiphe pulchra]
MDRLRIRAEKEMAQYRDSSSICISIIDTLLENKKSRLASWFAINKRLDKFDWQNLLDVIQCEFEDFQTQQTAHEFVLRMDIELLHTAVKNYLHRQLKRQLKASLNNRLRRAIIGVKLPPVSDYEEWVREFCRLPAQGGSAALPESSRPERDPDGDTTMTGMDATLAAIKELKFGIQEISSISGKTKKDKKEKKRDLEKGRGKKPRAPWRSKIEFDRLYKEGIPGQSRNAPFHKWNPMLAHDCETFTRSFSETPISSLAVSYSKFIGSMGSKSYCKIGTMNSDKDILSLQFNTGVNFGPTKDRILDLLIVNRK